MSEHYPLYPEDIAAWTPIRRTDACASCENCYTECEQCNAFDGELLDLIHKYPNVSIERIRNFGIREKPVFSGQCSHGLPLGQHCEHCTRSDRIIISGNRPAIK